ncbi:putative Woronin body protein HexA [Aspergillus undulatus]|uniref:putative Woronin body protein HexA n=1 Tax=Aspergillus undulatus TaxID=1810928 RepID=UPI003CCDED2B
MRESAVNKRVTTTTSVPSAPVLLSFFLFLHLHLSHSHLPFQALSLSSTFLPQEFSAATFGRDSRKDAQRTANLDFDARVPIPFSVFPSSYRSDAVPETTLAAERVEGEVNLDRTSHVEREDTRTSAPLPDPRVHGKEEVDLHFERRSERPERRGADTFTVVDERVQESRYPAAQDNRFPQVDLARERFREPTAPRYQDWYQDKQHTYDEAYQSQIDITEREYRRRIDPNYDVQASYGRRSAPVESHEGPRRHTSDVYSRSSAPNVSSYDRAYQQRPLDIPSGNSYSSRQVSVESAKAPAPSTDKVKVYKTTTVVDHPKARKMGYYDDDGNYHSFRRGVERAVDRITHPFHHRDHHDHAPHREHHHHQEVIVADERGPVRYRDGVRENVRIVEPRGGASPAETVPIPCHFIRTGDILILQGRPSQVIRISQSPSTGQHRYLGVDLFTRELHEESSFVSNPSPSVVVQTMLGPVYKTYRILDIRDDSLVALTESGDVKTGLPVVPQDGLYQRIKDAFHDGRGSVRVLVINDGGRELVVDFKLIPASRL